MKLYSTNDKTNIVNLEKATLRSLPDDNGLYLPLSIPDLEKDFINNLSNYSFPEIAFEISRKIIGTEIPAKILEQICDNAINFPAPLVQISGNIHIHELFYGPSLAFKDFGARFMAELMSYFVKEKKQKLTILVATSGDTGGAVAAGFHNIPNIEVIILYPSGKVSPIQEKQLTTWGDNIHAIEWVGTFDDCQAVVKKAFIDKGLINEFNLSSANSINIARLIPQTFYYFEAIKQLDINKAITISVPSGNLGNITAASLARRMGLPITNLIAAHNSNSAVFEYYNNRSYLPMNSISTMSNAMDVGNPSNFPRYLELHDSDYETLIQNTEAFTISDNETKESLLELYEQYNYISEPHATVAYAALKKSKTFNIGQQVFLGTAHPAKFQELVESILPVKIEIPPSLSSLESLIQNKTTLASYDAFKEWMLSR